MAITFRCPTCDATLRVADSSAGKKIRCGGCLTTLSVPFAMAEPAPGEVELQPQPSHPRDDHDDPPRPRSGSSPRDDHDDVPRPRPRRRERFGEPPPPAKSSTKLFLCVVVGCLVVIGLIAVVVWRVQRGPTEWRTHQSARGGYKVDLPAAPRADIAKDIGLPPLPGGEAEGTVHRRQQYVVLWAEIQNRQWRTDEQIIEDSFRGARESGDVVREKRGEPFTVGGFPARDIELHADTGESIVLRVVVADTRLYVLVAGGPGADVDDPNFRRFLDSFEITDARLKSVAQKREEEVAKVKEAERLRQEALEVARKEQERIRAEAEARRKEEERKAAEEQARRDEEARIAAAKARMEAEVAAAKFREAVPGVSAPDPTTLEGLKLYLSFDKVDEKKTLLWPEDTATVSEWAMSGPGPRGRAVYHGLKCEGVTFPIARLPGGVVSGSTTVAGWVKTQRKWGGDLLRVGGKQVDRDLMTLGLTHGPTERFSVRAVLNTSEEKRFPGEFTRGAISVSCSDDEQWHHIAVTRDNLKSDRADLYLDGNLAATYEFSRGPGEAVGWVSVGRPTHTLDERQQPKHPDLPVVGVDELCVFNRPLAAHEIRYLAGKAKTPDAPPETPMRLAPLTTLGPLAGVAFDPERKTVWAVTATHAYWDKVEWNKVSSDQEPAYLLRYSYPDFRLVGRWTMTSKQINGRLLQALAGAPILDAKNNRLYVPIDYGLGAQTVDLQSDFRRYGTFHRYDLDSLPPTNLEAQPPVLVPHAKMPPSESRKIGDAFVSPDGEWLYYLDLSPGKEAVCRIGPDLGSPERLPVAGGSDLWTGLWPSRDGKTIRTVQPGKRGEGNDSGLLEIDVARWTASAVKDVRGVDWDQRPRAAIAAHPDGRSFAAGRTGVTETRADGSGQVRPTMLRGPAFFQVSANGRYLFAADAENPRNRLVVLDTRAEPNRPDPLAVLDQEESIRVGGPFTVAPDGQFVVFRSGLVVRLDEGDAALKPPPKFVPASPKPNPRDPGTPEPPAPTKLQFVGGPVTAASEIKGLKFYLPCDEIVDGEVKETVSGKPGGKLLGTAELTDGPCGKALRLSVEGSPTAKISPSGLRFTDTERLMIPATKPFTLGVWMRWDDQRFSNVSYPMMGRPLAASKTRHSLSLLFADKKVTLWLSGLTKPEKQEPVESAGLPEPGKWHHFAFVRDEKLVLRMFIDGVVVPNDRPSTIPWSFEYDWFSLVNPGRNGTLTLDIDEFCLFDRALGADEIAGLAGRKEPANPKKPKTPEPKFPKPPEPPGGISIAPPPRAKPGAYAGGVVTSAKDIPGLVWYLDCEKVTDGKAIEAVSGKTIGETSDGRIDTVPGPRGQAVRLVSRKDDPKAATTWSLPELVAKSSVGKGKPFTMALWVRVESTAAEISPNILYASNKQTGGVLAISMSRDAGKALVYGRLMPESGGFAIIHARDSAREDWFHVAFTRSEKGETSILINGLRDRNTIKAAPADGAMRIDHVQLFPQLRQGIAMEVDEVCFFDRVLTDDEIAALAGKKELANPSKPKTPEPKISNPPVPSGVSVVPPPRVRLAAASEIKGLKFYLPCDEIADGQVTEAVSNKPGGKLGKGELVDGMRGKALRLTIEQPMPGKPRTPALMIIDPQRLAIPENTPFTFSYWLRLENPNRSFGPQLFEAGAVEGQPSRQVLSISYSTRLLNMVFRERTDPARPALTTVARVTGVVQDPAKWHHVAVIRNEKNEIRLLINGIAMPDRNQRFAGNLEYESFGILSTPDTKVALEIDEFCLFDRALTDDEIVKLVGKKPTVILPQP